MYINKVVNIKNMEIIAHRINTVEALKKLPKDVGFEVDLRGCSTPDKVYCQHEPYSVGESFEKLLNVYANQQRKGTIILDIKDERIEKYCQYLLKLYGVKNYFFLDCSFPMIYSLTSNGEPNVAIRYSQYEGVETAVRMAEKAKWIWVDTFTTNPLDKNTYELLKKLNYKICFVSPELQGQPEKKEKYLKELEEEGITLDAICTDVE